MFVWKGDYEWSKPPSFKNLNNNSVLETLNEHLYTFLICYFYSGAAGILLIALYYSEFQEAIM